MFNLTPFLNPHASAQVDLQFASMGDLKIRFSKQGNFVHFAWENVKHWDDGLVYQCDYPQSQAEWEAELESLKLVMNAMTTPIVETNNVLVENKEESVVLEVQEAIPVKKSRKKKTDESNSGS